MYHKAPVMIAVNSLICSVSVCQNKKKETRIEACIKVLETRLVTDRFFWLQYEMAASIHFATTSQGDPHLSWTIICIYVRCQKRVLAGAWIIGWFGNPEPFMTLSGSQYIISTKLTTINQRTWTLSAVLHATANIVRQTHNVRLCKLKSL